MRNGEEGDAGQEGRQGQQDRLLDRCPSRGGSYYSDSLVGVFPVKGLGVLLVSDKGLALLMAVR